MSKKDALATLNIYKLFVRETDALIGLYELGKGFVTNLPEISRAESTIIEQMERYVQSLPGSGEDDHVQSSAPSSRPESVRLLTCAGVAIIGGLKRC